MWVRVVATRSAKPAPASQAEKASRIIGRAAEFIVLNWRAHRDSAINNESISPSKHRRAERK